MGFYDKTSDTYECDVCGKNDNRSFMHTLYDGKICGECFRKIGREKYECSLSVRDAAERVALYNAVNGDWSKIPPFPYRSFEEFEMACKRNRYTTTYRYKELTNQYYDDLPKIDTQWSVLYNLKDFEGNNAKLYEKLCIKSINTFKKIYEEFCIPYDTVEFTCVPAYKRLAMLYEKQKKYDKATYVCLDAIQHGVPNEYGDNDGGKMYARLARMAKKSGLYDDVNVKNVMMATTTKSKHAYSSDEILHTKWGDYIKPVPYTINVTRGPRNDLKKIN